MDYNNDNIFAKILRGEIPCDKVSEEDRAMAFNDINPQAKVHALVIPKGAYISFADFSECADDAEIVSFVRHRQDGATTGGGRNGLPIVN